MDHLPSLGLIGLGIMGRPMARNLMKAGHGLTVYDLSEAAVAELVAEGATRGTSPRDVAAGTEVLITMLPEPGGLAAGEFDGYGATARTLRAFTASYHELLATVRDIVLPDPDKRPA